jgi:hypothetical protein
MNDKTTSMSARERHEDRLQRFREAERAEFRVKDEERRILEQQEAAAERRERLEEMREIGRGIAEGLLAAVGPSGGKAVDAVTRQLTRRASKPDV